ncbi:hypothetical protein OEZ86_014241 [Tetradesmus obliquus]|nr:hypothetical protein OEZ86_014241 [Tetradesmus obliquus]
MGLLDGISIGAVYGEAGIVGPATAHAVVAGYACGFLLLVSLLMITKAALPDTTQGLRLSFCIYFGVTGGLVLAALAAYLKMIRPAVQAAIAEAEVGESERGDELAGMPPLKAACSR